MAQFQLDPSTSKLYFNEENSPEIFRRLDLHSGVKLKEIFESPDHNTNDLLFGEKPEFLQLKPFYRVRLKDFQEQDFILFPYRKPDSTVVEITLGIDSQETFTLLKDSEIINKIPWPVAIISTDYSLKFLNEAFASLFYGPSAGTPCFKIIHDRAESCFGCPLNFAINCNCAAKIQFHNKLFKRYFEESVVPFYNDEGFLKYFLLFLYDNTEQIELKRRSDEIQKINALGRMAAGIAHDFNNLLTTIIGRAQILSFAIQDEKLKNDLQAILTAAEDSASIVRRIQLYSSKKNRLELLPVNINKIITEAVDISAPKWRTTARRKGKILEVELDLKASQSILGNPSELRNMLVNMIFNAVDAMEYGGVLSISTRDNDYFVVIEISDTGVGIPEENLERIFDPFFTTKGEKGSGLGLSEVVGTVNRHNGSIDVTSEVGQGTTFTIKFPVTQQKEPDREPSQKITRIPGKLKIAIIDDNPTITETMSKMLSDKHSVDIYSSPEEFFHHLDQIDYDLIFTDLGMPNIPGDRLAKLVKERYPQTPIVLITGWIDGTSYNSENYRGYIDYVLQKPFTREQLDFAITSVFSRK